MAIPKGLNEVTGTDLVVNSLTIRPKRGTAGAVPDSPYTQVADPGTVASGLTIASVVRDVSGRIVSYTENGAPVTLTRDNAGRVSTFTMLGTTRTVTRDTSGRVTGVA